jgi:predicted permease
MNRNAMLDAALRDARYAFRSFTRAPLAAATIIATVGVGLGLVAAVFTILSSMLFQTDAVRNPHELFGIERPVTGTSEPEPFTREQYEALLRETDVFVDAFATTSDEQAQIDGVRREGRLVTGNFFAVLGASAARGRALVPSDDEPGRPPVIVLSHRSWLQQYAADPNVVGRTFRVNGTPFEVIGVMPADFRGLEIIAAPDFWAPLSTLDVVRRTGVGEGASTLNVVGRLEAGVSSDQARAQLVAWDMRRAVEERADERPTASLVLAQRSGTIPRPAEAMLVFMPLFFAFGLILLLGCANVANLLLARLVARQREIGIRLSLGASRRRVVWQLLTESLMLALIAAAFAFGISRALLNATVYAVTTSFPPDIGNLRIAVPPADWRLVLFLVLAAMASTVLFALGPALRATRVQVSRAVHSDLRGAGRSGRVRDVLVTAQVTGSVLLLICAAIFLRGTWAAASRDPGVRTADVVNVSVRDEQKRAAILDVVQTDAAVAAVAASWPAFFGGLSGVPAYGEGASGRSVVKYQFVSPNFFDVLGLDIVRGRGFAANERNPNEAVAMVSETVARELWPGIDAIGQSLRIEPDPTIGRPANAPPLEPQTENDPLLRARTAVVIGVTRDVPGFQIGGVRIAGSGVYMPIEPAAADTALITRVRGNVDIARNGLVDRLAAIDPNMAEISTLETLVRADTYLLGTSFWLTVVLGGLALLLTLSGIFSVLSYLVEQRRPEIGVRMALGASRRSIGAMVLKQGARPVGLGVAIGSSLAIGLAAVLLASPAAEQMESTVSLFDPVAYAGSLLLVIGACAGAALLPALRAGRVNPLSALRQD